jgi:hypothetical protein
MASTPKVIAFSVSSQVLPAVEKITQQQLSDFIEARNVLARLQERVDEIEESLRTRLEAGADVQPGVHVASLKENLRRNVAWKDVTMRLAERLDYEPEAYCSNVLAHTKPSRTISLVVN